MLQKESDYALHNATRSRSRDAYAKSLEKERSTAGYI